MTASLNPGRPFTGTERQLLENTLHLQRSELLAAVGGLSDAQARLHLVPSLTTPISLVKHCAAAERIWFQRTLDDRCLGECTGQAVGGDASFHVGDHETLDNVVAEYKAACATSDDIAAHHTLDDTADHAIVGNVNLRFIYLGLIAEIARHAGHADILVEQIRAICNDSDSSQSQAPTDTQGLPAIAGISYTGGGSATRPPSE